MSLEECLSHISKGRAEFCDTLWWPAPQTQNFQTFLRPGFTAALMPRPRKS